MERVAVIARLKEGSAQHASCPVMIVRGTNGHEGVG
jgi:hypothetical protein